MLNDQQIEQAARKLCELRGIDPDCKFTIRVYIPPEKGQILSSVNKEVSQWETLADEIHAYLQVQEAVDYAQKMAAIEWMGEKGHQAASFCPPPGPCACEHSFADHRILGEVGGCRRCGCFDYVAA